MNGLDGDGGAYNLSESDEVQAPGNLGAHQGESKRQPSDDSSSEDSIFQAESLASEGGENMYSAEE